MTVQQRKKGRGGKRPGAGRKWLGGPPTIKVSVNFNKEIIIKLKKLIPRGKRSQFVNTAVQEKIEKLL